MGMVTSDKARRRHVAGGVPAASVVEDVALVDSP